MEFSCRCHSTTGGITSSTLLPFGLWAPGITDTYLLEQWYILPYYCSAVTDDYSMYLCVQVFRSKSIAGMQV